MKRIVYITMWLLLAVVTVRAQILITGVIDGPLSGGTPKAIELYVLEAIPDLSVVGIESANNGGGSSAPEMQLSGSAQAGDFIYIASEQVNFNAFFGFEPNFTNNVASINGDDAVILYFNGNMVDCFGEADTDGTGEIWEYLDAWAYRKPGTGPDFEIFDPGNWNFSGINILDGASNNATATVPFPLKSYTPAIHPPTAPSNHVLNFTASSVGMTANSIELSWDENDGEQPPTAYLIKASTAEIDLPAEGVLPTDDTELSDGSGNVSVDHGTSVYTFTSCSQGTTYNFSIFPYLQTSDTIIYKAKDAPQASATTQYSTAPPVFSPEAGVYADSVLISISSTTDEAVIFYTLDGTIPDEHSLSYHTPFNIHQSCWLSAIAVAGNDTSDMVVAYYKITTTPVVLNPVISPPGGEFSDSIQISISCETPGAEIYYTLDQSRPGEQSLPYDGSFYINETLTIKTIAIKEGISSEVQSADFYLKEVPAPIEVNSIAELRSGDTDGHSYLYSGVALIIHAVQYNNQKYIRDESAAILINDPEGKLGNHFVANDALNNISGSLIELYGMLALVPDKEASIIKDHQLSDAPIELTIDELKDNPHDYESNLILLKQAEFSSSGAFALNNDYPLFINGEELVMRVHFEDTAIDGSPIPEGKVDVTGLAIWHNHELKLAPRSINDIKNTSSAEQLDNRFHITMHNKNIIINHPDQQQYLLCLVNTEGRMLQQINTSGTSSNIGIELPGIYLVLIQQNGKNVWTRKISIVP